MISITQSIDATDMPQAGDPPTASRMQRTEPFYYWSVLLSLLTYIVRPGEVFPFLNSAKLGLVSFALVGVAFFASGGLPKVRNMPVPGTKSFAWLLAIGFIGIPFSIYGSYSFQFWQGTPLIFTSLFFFWRPMINTASGLRSFVNMLVIAAACIVVFLLQFNAVYEIAGGQDDRFSVGISYDPNDTAMLLAVFFCFMCYLFFRGRFWAKLVYSTTMAGSVFGILATGSRGGLLALCAACVALAFGARSAVKTWHKLFVIVLAIGFLLSPAADPMKERWQGVFSGDDYNFTSEAEGGDGRLVSWSRGIRLMAKYPLTGVGIGNSSTAMGSQYHQWRAVHSAYIQIGLELGLPGLLVFLLVLRAIWRNTTTAHRRFTAQADPHKLAVLATCTRTALITYMTAAFFLSQAYSILVPLLLIVSQGLLLASDSLDDANNDFVYPTDAPVSLMEYS